MNNPWMDMNLMKTQRAVLEIFAKKYSHVSKMSRQTGSQSGKSENTKLRTSNWRGKGKTRPTKRKHGTIQCLRTYKKQQTLHSALSYTSKV